MKEATSDTVYTGVFLDEASHKGLLEFWQQLTGVPLLGNVFAHHMTIKFKPSKEELAATPVGQSVILKVVGWAADDRGQAVLVKPEGITSANANPHITVACAPGTSPVYSNELLGRGFTRVDGPALRGIVGGK